MAAPAAYGFTVFSEAANLDNTNYSVWKTKVKILITYNGFWTWLTDASMAVKPALTRGSFHRRTLIRGSTPIGEYILSS